MFLAIFVFCVLCFWLYLCFLFYVFGNICVFGNKVLKNSVDKLIVVSKHSPTD